MQERLQKLTSMPVSVIWHENKTTYLSVKKERGKLFLRLHRLFFNAPTPVLEALIRYAMNRDDSARIVIKQMAHLHFSQTTVEADPLNPVGKVYNLQEIFNQVQEILPVTKVSIGWSNRSRQGSFRSITFGTFDKHRRQIRINSILDTDQVPLYFLKFIVYHEMLHAVCPTKMDATGRCLIHTAEFRRREKEFPQFEEAKEWEKKSLTFFKKRKSHGRP
ncbi:MAG: hypothetical protein COT85_07505 [Chlamydiae bacterium CG10_big_fil_rev_8_21_14_0_10_42_34]|nr:MAG: hypothetical protein COT85_07505 [Chlamydiae bacterium CG10_big_fil_rev_8_21_14_0_10_42_34]